MTKKDFQFIADVIRTTRLDASVENPIDNYEKGFEAGIKAIENQFNLELQRNNPKFDIVRFEKICNPYAK